MKTEMPHQIEAREWLVQSPRAFLCDDTGVGKTIEAISSHKQLGGKAVLLCESNKVFDWQLEYAEWAPLVTRYVAIGNPNKRKEIYRSFYLDKGDCVLITNHSKVIVDISFFLKLNNKIVIIDECDVINNITKTHRYMKMFFAGKEVIWMLSAYPFATDLSQFYNLFNAIGVDIFGSYFDFIEKYCVVEMKRIIIRGKKISKRTIVGAKNVEEFKRLAAPYCMRRTLETAGVKLPPMSFKAIGSELSARQRQMYTAAKKNKLDTMTRKEKFEPIARYAFITQILNSPHLIDSEETEKSPKLETMIKELKKINKKAIVFTQFKKWFPVVIREIEKEGIKVFRYSGDESLKKRHEAEVEFKNYEGKAVFLGTGAMKKGINLQFIDTIFVLDFMFNPVNMLQLFGRIERIGQEKAAIIYYFFMTGTHEETIFSTLLERQELIDDVMGSDKSASFDLAKIFENRLSSI